ncbi:protocatechuate 3,4-dioxygenase subunit alpha [Nocardioides sp. CFH 31398]|uniref:protocatechuate 3,4-dioxygenase subunit alpha n=1 Tax=Nocardioides sp. CFH 31398 TaxID=2919579 RepID=UPI001F063717|nr:protocatechuate 3,4-dioxygenase subunit alpha [Nocardioides sp. CFH 31398]MCH1867905.1 protocatechuate 3,4-dioxygenase subunit alpha [Nocardioides sp. CFH 31398]
MSGVRTEGDLAPTPGQTVGPFYGYALPYDGDSALVPAGRADAIRLHGVVTDGAGAPVPDALLEIWQADADGSVPARPGSLRRDGWTFTGWGRCATLDDGSFSFSTVLPGRRRGASGEDQAPYVAVTVFARGLLDRLLTRAYLPSDAAEAGSLLSSDPLLASLPPERARTLVATPDATGFRFDVRLQGEDETVFLTHA